jgi:hypothetical protein
LRIIHIFDVSVKAQLRIKAKNHTARYEKNVVSLNQKYGERRNCGEGNMTSPAWTNASVPMRIPSSFLRGKKS